MAALTAAFELSEGRWRDRFQRITVYQRGWRLGGKGASSRGANGRIEEHGLHVLLGYYDHTFELMRRCYDELDRAVTDPRCPIRSWDDAVSPANRVGVADLHDGRWVPWMARFSATPGMPGTPGNTSSWPASPAEIARRSLQLLADFLRSLAPARPSRTRDRIYLSASPLPEGGKTEQLGDIDALVRGAAVLGLVIPFSMARRLTSVGNLVSGSPDGGLPRMLEDLRVGLRGAVNSNAISRRTLHLVEIVTANLVGIFGDGLLEANEDYRSIDHLDYREWLSGHGIDPEALSSPLLRGMYDLTFAYEQGDPSRPRFSAGLGLQLATRMLLGYSGGPFWKMRAGMGEIVFAPLYQVLFNRGVDFRFFHRVDSVRLSTDRRSVQAIEMGLQAEPASSTGVYSPLAEVNGLPCWPAEPLKGQVVRPEWIEDLDLESYWSPRRDSGKVVLRAGEDFDQVVFGISLGMVPYVCGELIEESPAWRSMVSGVGTVATQAFQLWLKADERELGWPGNPGDIVSGFTEPFDTWASMSHLLEFEDWPDAERPKSIAYFCSPLSPEPPRSQVSASDAVLARTREFLDREVKVLWPRAVGPKGFRWDLLCDGDGAGRLTSQFWKANVDPSDLYVQSLPGTDSFRMAPNATGFDNLLVTGDWTDCGLNAGCLEAATMSGKLAAAAVTERATCR